MSLGKLLVSAGIAFLVAGALVLLAERMSIRPGQLPGDIVIRGKNSVFYFPIVTCLILSVIFSLVSWMIGRR